MNRNSCLAVLSVLFIAASAADGRAQEAAATAAVKASPALVNTLAKEIGATPEQAAGAAGTLFGVAKSRLTPQEFSQVASAVPGMDSLLRAARATTGAVGTVGSLPQLGDQPAVWPPRRLRSRSWDSSPIWSRRPFPL
jgi:hypothetical protein